MKCMEFLNQKKIDLDTRYHDLTGLWKTANYFGDSEINLLHFLLRNKTRLARELRFPQLEVGDEKFIVDLAEIGLVNLEARNSHKVAFLSEVGKQFLLRLKMLKNLD